MIELRHPSESIGNHKTREKTVSGKGPSAIVDPSPLLAELRIRKSESEISIMREAAIIASNAHTHAMRNTMGDSSEAEIQSLDRIYIHEEPFHPKLWLHRRRG